ncbi:hypothetical protein RI367_004613 [Sorochytrium milnesiophthora]
MSAIAREAAKALNLPVLAHRPKTLYEALVRLPNHGVNAKVVPLKYVQRDYPKDSYYEVTRVKMHPTIASHGKAWGYFVWKGHKRNSVPREIRGGLKQPWVVVDRSHVGEAATTTTATQ